MLGQNLAKITAGREDVETALPMERRAKDDAITAPRLGAWVDPVG